MENLRHYLGWLILGTALLMPAVADAQKVSEPAIKAAIAHKITKFVQWPNEENPATPQIRFCIAESPAVFQAMMQLQPHPVRGRSLTVVNIDDPAAISSSCDALYVGDTGPGKQQAWLSGAADRPILTFTESDTQNARGIVTLYVRNKRVRFDIDSDASARAGISIGAQLLQLAALGNSRRR